MVLAICDGNKGCHKEFRLEKFEVDKLDKGIEKTYFNCPHCDKEYLVYYTDAKIRAKQKQKAPPNEIKKDMDNLKQRLQGAQ